MRFKSTLDWIKRGPKHGRTAARKIGLRHLPRVESLEGRQMLSTVASSLSPQSLTWDPQGGGIQVTYRVSGPALPAGSKLDFFWASGTTAPTEIGGAACKAPVATAAGTYGPLSIPAAALGLAPQGARYLLAVADTGPQGPASSQVVALAYDPLRVDAATEPNSQTVALTYEVGEAATEQALTVAIYRSASPQFSPGNAILVNTLSVPSKDQAGVSSTALGTHTVNLPDRSALLPDPRHEYVHVVIDPSHRIGDPLGTVHEAHFRKFVLGAASHGFLAFGQLTGIPAWETQVVKDLKTIDGYDQVIPFDWTGTSNVLKPGLAVAAGHRLAGQIVSTADALVRTYGHTGDVVDLHLIGHSRGAVVISQAFQDLVGTTDPVLAGGYKVMTTLDPHPGNNAYFKPDASIGTGLLAEGALAALTLGEAAVQDPQVVIPPDVDAAQDDYQHTPASAFLGPSSLEIDLNPWGEAPGLLINRSAAPLVSVDLTSRIDPVIGPVGHTQLPFWYDRYVVQQGAVFPGYRS
jgi:hypothetical protein